MYKNKYPILAAINLLLGIGAICLYLPYTIEIFNIKWLSWLDFAADIFKDSYYNILIYFGIFLLGWIIATNLVSIFSHANLPKVLFKLSIVSALILPLIYVMALKYEFVLEFWIKNIAPNLKTICYIFLCVACGLFISAIVCNFTNNNKANIHHLTQALVMCTVLILVLAINGWCGWNINSTIKLFGVLMGVYAIYLPISTIILLICAKNRL